MTDYNPGPATTDTPNLTDESILSGTYLSTNLPPANSVLPGRIVYTSDQGLMVSSGTAWASLVASGTPGSAGVAKTGAATYAAARLLVGTATGDTLYVFGRTTQSDGGQGLFTWVAGGSTTVNDGFQLTATGGIWQRADLTHLTPEMFGAKRDGFTDDTVAIQAAINAIAASAIVEPLYLQTGTYAVGPLLIQNGDFHLIGQGVQQTILQFTPTGNATTVGVNTTDPGTCIQACKNGGTNGNVLFNASLENFQIYSTDVSFSKVALRLCEVGEFQVRNFLITGFYGHDTVGIQTMGHEHIILDNIQILATLPIRISRGLGLYGGVYYCDHFQFQNLLIQATGAAPSTLPNACVLIDDGMFVSSLNFDGYQAWVGGQYGLYWNQPTAPPTNISSYQIIIKNVRKEQGVGTGPCFYLSQTSGTSYLLDISFINCFNADGYTTWYLRGDVRSISMTNCIAYGLHGASYYVADIGTGTFNMQWTGMSCFATDKNLYANTNLAGPMNATFYVNYLLPYTGTWTGFGFPVPGQQRVLLIPTTGFSQTFNSWETAMLITPAGTLATGTITMCTAPVDNQEVSVSSSETITALTVSPNTGQTMVGAPTALTKGGVQGFTMIYYASQSKWYRLR